MASPMNLNGIYPGGLITSSPTFSIEHIIFDGVNRSYPLGKRPLIMMSATLDGSIPLSIGWKGQGGIPGVHDAVIDPTSQPPTITFLVTPSKGRYADIIYQYDPGAGAPVTVTPKVANEDLPLVPEWEEWDYQNYRDFAAAVREDKPVEFALCMWLMQQEHTTIVFNDTRWERWYKYARSHCPRFDTSEPAWRK